MSELPATLPAPLLGPAAAANGAAAPVGVAAPADMLPPARRWERLAWYAGTMVLAAVLAAVGMQLWNRDLHAPFYYDLDALLYLPLTRTVVEQGFWDCWHAERMGAPGRQELYDFPIIDFVHFAFLWLLGKVFPDVLVAYNVYSLLTYPLTALTAMWVLRWLKLSLPAAALGGLLYAFLPYHQERYHYHYFLAAYWWVPVSLVPAIAICRGDFPFFRRTAGGYYPLEIDWPHARATARGAVRAEGAAWKAVFVSAGRGTRWLLRNLFTWRALWPILVGVVTASAGAYYAFFACAAYAFAGVYAWVVYRTWRGAASAALVIAPVVAVGCAYHVPTFFHHLKYGQHQLTARQPHEAESYGLKLAHLLLPTNDHNFRPFANLRTQYANPLRPAEGESAGSLGVIGGVGLMALMGLVLLPFRKRWPEGPIAALTVYLVLLGTVGAVGSLFNLLVTAQIRAYNRISVFIAFLAFFAVLWWIDRYLLTRTGRTMRRLRYPAFALLLVLGYLDQTPWGWNPLNPNGMTAIDEFAERFEADKRFFKQVERAMPPGSRVFCLPYSAFPESPPVYKMGAYEHARGYVMTDTLCWSFGAIKGREADVWQKDVSYMMKRQPEQMLKRIVARGFEGLLVDGRGFPPAKSVDHAAALINRLNGAYQAMAGTRAVALPTIVHEDGKQFFLDLQPFRDAWRAKEPAKFAAMEKYEREWVAPLWLAGFLVTDPSEDGEWYVWGTPDATMWLVNPTDRARNFTLSFTIGVDSDGPFRMRLSGLVNDSFDLDRIPGKDENDTKRYGTPKSYTFELPPGRSSIRIRCSPPDYFSSDSRNLCYFVKDFKLTEK
jgi:hypothetical protein